ncbi:MULTISPECIES: MerR family transcriptional regulator [Psychrobacter]|uniref:MerR family transcriptional regulator n=1 Tax=Psychrobacter TaxID=497 RepID=UPI003FD0974E
MQIQKFAALIGVSPRVLRHYEAAGLITPRRNDSGYRIYDDNDLRRATRIRDLIAAGFSTREIYAISPCLSDDGAGACEQGLAGLKHKREQIERLILELKDKHEAVTAQIDSFNTSLLLSVNTSLLLSVNQDQ